MVLLVVDVQKGITDERLYAFDTFIDRITRLINAARKNGTEVVCFQHDLVEGFQTFRRRLTKVPDKRDGIQFRKFTDRDAKSICFKGVGTVGIGLKPDAGLLAE